MVEIDGGEKYNVANTTTHGSARFRASDLVEQALNGRVPTAYDEQEDGSWVINQQETVAAREKQQQLKDRFREWIWEDGARAAAKNGSILQLHHPVHGWLTFALPAECSHRLGVGLLKQAALIEYFDGSLPPSTVAVN